MTPPLKILPNGFYWISAYGLIGSGYDHAMFQGLANEESIEGVFVNLGKFCQKRQTCFLQWQWINQMALSLFKDVGHNRAGQRELAKLIFKHDFPNRDNA